MQSPFPKNPGGKGLPPYARKQHRDWKRVTRPVFLRIPLNSATDSGVKAATESA
jgi:hypothetical protein